MKPNRKLMLAALLLLMGAAGAARSWPGHGNHIDTSDHGGGRLMSESMQLHPRGRA